MKKKKKGILIGVGALLVIGLIGSLTGNRDKPQEIRVVTERSAAETEATEPTPTPKPTEKPTPTPEPTPTEAPVQTLEPVETDAAAPDRSAPAADPTPTPAPGRDYVLNMNTMKFHYPSCSSVADIKSANRKDVHMTREEVVAMGYAPCGRCKP